MNGEWDNMCNITQIISNNFILKNENLNYKYFNIQQKNLSNK